MVSLLYAAGAFYLLWALYIVVMALVHAWALGGGVFYLGREVRDRERLGTWDHKGLWWSVLASLGLWLLAVPVPSTPLVVGDAPATQGEA